MQLVDVPEPQVLHRALCNLDKAFPALPCHNWAIVTIAIAAEAVIAKLGKRLEQVAPSATKRCSDGTVSAVGGAHYFQSVETTGNMHHTLSFIIFLLYKNPCNSLPCPSHEI